MGTGPFFCCEWHDSPMPAATGGIASPPTPAPRTPSGDTANRNGPVPDFRKRSECQGLGRKGPVPNFWEGSGGGEVAGAELGGPGGWIFGGVDSQGLAG